MSIKAHDHTSNRQSGFSIVELVVVTAIIMIITGVAVPTFITALRMYQLSSAADQVVGILKFTRYEAIRRNKSVNCIINQSGSNTITIWADTNGSGSPDSTEKQTILTGSTNVVPVAGVPSTGALATAAKIPTLTPVSTTNGTLKFDQRGAVNPTAVYVIYVGNTGVPAAGYRAIILLPSGSVQTWSSDTAGGWHMLY